jgi:PilZ domain
MEPNKRRFVRKRTDQLLYAEFGPDNGSILLNLSEEGCSFQSMAPVREQQLRFWVSVGDGRKLEGDGQMVWSDTAKKTGGLRFLNPSKELREQVRDWLEETLVTADGKLDPGALESQAKRRRKKLREEARAAAELAWKEGALKAGEMKPAGETEIGAANAGVAESATTRMSSRDRAADDLTFQGNESPTGTLRGVGALGLSAILLMTLIGYRRELGHLLMSFGSSIAGEEQKSGVEAPAEARPVPENVTSSVTSEVSSPAKPAAMSDGDTTKESGAEVVPISNEQVTPVADVSNGAAKRSSTQPAGAREDVPSLWTSVENGDMHAEVALANKYVRGEGVPQSCAQARVLLEAALKRGSAEAKQKLDELPGAGCP